MYRRVAQVAVVAAAASAVSQTAVAQVTCPNPPTAVERTYSIQSGLVGYYASHSLSTNYNPNVRRAIFLIHGLHGVATSSYDVLADATCRAQSLGIAPNAAAETIVIAPKFRSDKYDTNNPSGYHVWNDDNWSKGSESVNGHVSSYAVIDGMIGMLVGSSRTLLGLQRRFPNLEMIVIAGHSAGGQFAHRYAATNPRDGQIGGVRMRYIVANPSSYLYLDDLRPYTDYASGVGDPYTQVGTPFGSMWVTNPGFSDAPICPGSYNDWKFGLSDLNNYSSAVGASLIRLRLTGREVTVLLGTADNDPDADDLDTSCPAMLQGTNRYERGQRLINHLDIRYPWHSHRQLDVVGIAHSQSGMFGSYAGSPVTGLDALFVD
jgi:hypothetical protein